ncbi:MAG: hypothetical protein ACPGWR_01865 [Ardenticatenaceae bacterium]
MGMKEITLPKELLNLPQPWGKTHPKQRREGIDLLSYEMDSIKTALNVLERCLHTLSELTLSENDCIPDDLHELWTFSANWLALSIPTFDDFDLKKVEQFLINDEGIDSPSPELIRDVGEYWLWWVTWEIERAVLRWVQRALMKTREPSLISDFLYVAERYWLLVEPDLGSSLLSRSAMIGWQKALPLFESVEQNPKASEDILETVRDYRDLILDNPHKWLPESDAFSEWPTSENESDHLPQTTRRLAQGTATEPALAELAHV